MYLTNIKQLLTVSQSIFIMKQDKGHGVVFIDSSEYTESLSETRYNIGIKEIENKINSKSIVSYIPQTQTQVDSMALPNYINSHLMAPLKNFLIRPVVCNIGTARYPLAKYLA